MIILLKKKYNVKFQIKENFIICLGENNISYHGMWVGNKIHLVDDSYSNIIHILTPTCIKNGKVCKMTCISYKTLPNGRSLVSKALYQ